MSDCATVVLRVMAIGPMVVVAVAEALDEAVKWAPACREREDPGVRVQAGSGELGVRARM